MKIPSRKYIDLMLNTASSKWANWDPLNMIKVGDYGTVDKETGQFERDGNIYDDETTATLAALHFPNVGSPETIFKISSTGVTCVEFSHEANAGVVGLAEASVKGKWSFGKKRDALLIMVRPQSSYIPPVVFLKHLVNVPVLQNKFLVTEAVSCPAYSLYLSTADKNIVDIELAGDLPVPLAPGVTTGNEIGLGWRAKNSSGLFRSACEKTGSYKYTPLFVLKKIRRKGILRRKSPAPDPEDDDLWDDVQEPWDPLGDDGEELEFEDTVFD